MLFEGDGDALCRLAQRQAAVSPVIVPIHGLTSAALAAGKTYPLEWLVAERSISTNTAAAGGNASLMNIG